MKAVHETGNIITYVYEVDSGRKKQKTVGRET